MSKRLVLFLAFVLSFGALSAVAGTSQQDALGIQGLWDTVSAWLDDAYATRIVALIFFCVGVWRAFAGSILQFFLMLGFAVLVTQGSSIIQAVGGTF